MADDDEQDAAAEPEEQPPPRARVVHSNQRATELVVDRRIRAILDPKLQKLEERLGERIDGRPAAGSGGGVGGAALAEVVREVASLREVLDKLVAAHDNAPPPFHWDDLEPEERATLQAKFDEWVETVLRAWLPRQAKALKPCWQEHPGAVMAVSAAWFAWSAAYRGPARKGPEPMAWMKDLRALVTDLAEELGQPLAPCSAHPKPKT